MTDKLSERADNILAGILLKFEDRISAEAVAEIRKVLWNEVATLEQQVERLEGALMQTMAQNPECPLCRNGMEYRTSELGWWRLNHKDSCAWAKALAEDDLDKLTTQQKPTEEAMEQA